MIDSSLGRTELRRALVVGLTIYGVACLESPETYRVLDALDLAIHETGHLIFSPFGELMHFVGGTLFQLAFPLLFIAYFAHRKDVFAAYVVAWWVAQNLWNVSVYIADAPAQMLPLVGGGQHDWAYILGQLGLMGEAGRLSGLVHFAGVLVFGFAMFQAWHHARDGVTETETVGVLTVGEGA